MSAHAQELLIRKAASKEDMEAVWRLTHDIFVAQGYAKPRSDGMLRHYEKLDFIDEAGSILVDIQTSGANDVAAVGNLAFVSLPVPLYYGQCVPGQLSHLEIADIADPERPQLLDVSVPVVGRRDLDAGTI